MANKPFAVSPNIASSPPEIQKVMVARARRCQQCRWGAWFSSSDLLYHRTIHRGPGLADNHITVTPCSAVNQPAQLPLSEEP